MTTFWNLSEIKFQEGFMVRIPFSTPPYFYEIHLDLRTSSHPRHPGFRNQPSWSSNPRKRIEIQEILSRNLIDCSTFFYSSSHSSTLSVGIRTDDMYENFYATQLFQRRFMCQGPYFRYCCSSSYALTRLRCSSWSGLYDQPCIDTGRVGYNRVDGCHPYFSTAVVSDPFRSSRAMDQSARCWWLTLYPSRAGARSLLRLGFSRCCIALTVATTLKMDLTGLSSFLVGEQFAGPVIFPVFLIEVFTNLPSTAFHALWIQDNVLINVSDSACGTAAGSTCKAYSDISYCGKNDLANIFVRW